LHHDSFLLSQHKQPWKVKLVPDGGGSLDQNREWEVGREQYEGDDGKNERCEERIYKLKAIL